jgi:hypothetical protein
VLKKGKKFFSFSFLSLSLPKKKKKPSKLLKPERGSRCIQHRQEAATLVTVDVAVEEEEVVVVVVGFLGSVQHQPHGY